MGLPAVWSPLRPDGATIIGFSTVIDTSAALFQTTPRYSVSLIGPRVTTWDSVSVLVIELASIAQPTATSFTLQIALPSAGGANPTSVTDPTTGPQILNQLGWTIVWMGVGG